MRATLRARRKNSMVRELMIVGAILTGSLVPVVAAPVELSCKVVGIGAELYGRVSATIDLDARTVELRARVAPGVVWRYEDGKTAPVLEIGPPALSRYYPPVRQVVRVHRKTVTVGWRATLTEPLDHYAVFNRAALDAPGTPCVWRRMRIG
jgi:hypothetical protein